MISQKRDSGWQFEGFIICPAEDGWRFHYGRNALLLSAIGRE